MLVHNRLTLSATAPEITVMKKAYGLHPRSLPLLWAQLSAVPAGSEWKIHGTYTPKGIRKLSDRLIQFAQQETTETSEAITATLIASELFPFLDEELTGE